MMCLPAVHQLSLLVVVVVVAAGTASTQTSLVTCTSQSPKYYTVTVMQTVTKLLMRPDDPHDLGPRLERNLHTRAVPQLAHGYLPPPAHGYLPPPAHGCLPPSTSTPQPSGDPVVVVVPCRCNTCSRVIQVDPCQCTAIFGCNEVRIAVPGK